MARNIYFFHPSSELYGSDKILTYIIKCYPDFKKKVILKNEGSLIGFLQEECPDTEIQTIPTLPIIAKKNLNPKGIIVFLLSLLQFKKDLNKCIDATPSIIYLNTLAVIPILFYFRRLDQLKVVHVHEILDNSKVFNKIVNRIALKYADLLICVSNAVLNNLAVAAPKYKDKLKLVHNGIDIKETHAFGHIDIDKDKMNFVLIGRIKPSHKGQILLLEAISKLEPKYLKLAHFYFVGSTVFGQEYMMDEVLLKMKELDVEANITIIPFVKEIENIYNNIDVVVVPSVFEDPFPTTVLEGMFFGKPIIGTEVGGIPEMIEDGDTGFIVKRNDSQDLSSRIAYCIENPLEIIRLGTNGKQRFSQLFSEQSFKKRYNNVIKDIIDMNKK